MNRYLLHLIILSGLFISTTPSIAQPAKLDVLYRLDQTTLNVKVSEITGTDVFYSDLATPKTTQKIAKAQLWKVVFSDGTSDVFNSPKIGSGTTQRTAVSTSPSIRNQSPVTSAEPANRSVARTTPVRSRPVGSSDDDSPQSIIKYAPLSSFGYEKVLANNRSIYAGLSLYSVNTYFTRVTAIGLKGEYRFYGLAKSSPKQAPEGFWVAPTVLLWNVSARDIDDGFSESAFVAQIGGITGYQWVFNKKISLEPALGLSLTAVGTGTESILGAGIVPLFAVRVGYVLN